ncbi:MAG: efflux RND transporter periplasmic adaptor subunit [Burkholderiales bacterium]|nr:efflux RND transporter periplasmic adaptor subunit [Burkholderiales bacterium]
MSTSKATSQGSRQHIKRSAWLLGAALLGAAAWHQSPSSSAQADAPPPERAARAAKPALSVQVVQAGRASWPLEISANGAIAAWQEAVVGAELSGLRLSAVNVNVGDRVRRGQVLATLAAEAVEADIQSARAAFSEAVALSDEATANADRARNLRAADAISAQEAQRSLTAEQTAKARVASAKAMLAAQELRGRQTRVVAPDDGVISSRSATVGAVAQPGTELFRLIRQSRLEWRAEVPSAELVRVQPGMKVVATPPGGQPVEGRVRMASPTVDGATRNGLVYVDLPASAAQAGARAGMFAPGRITLGEAQGVSLPQGAVLLRDGFSYVFVVGADQVVRQVKVSVGRRLGERVEILQGLDAKARVVASGVAFLADGDTVRVVSDQQEGKARS